MASDIVAAHGEHLDRVEAIQTSLRGHQHEQASAAARTAALEKPPDAPGPS